MAILLVCSGSVVLATLPRESPQRLLRGPTGTRVCESLRIICNNS